MSCRLCIPLFEERFSGVKKKLYTFVCKCEWDYVVDWLLSTDRQKTNHISQHLPLLDLLQWNEQMNNEGAVSLFLHISQLLSVLSTELFPRFHSPILYMYVCMYLFIYLVGGIKWTQWSATSLAASLWYKHTQACTHTHRHTLKWMISKTIH